MTRLPMLLMGLAGAGVAGLAHAAPSLDIRDAAVRVIVEPEARSDVQVTVLKTNARLPIYVTRHGNSVVISGRLWPLFTGCHGQGTGMRVTVLGRGEFGVDDLPSVLVKTPLDAHVSAGGVVVGSVGRARSLELSYGGCGGWTIANVEQALMVRNSGTGRISPAHRVAPNCSCPGQGT